ncbi:hypothetical protein KW790_01310 [Candidatus Parcubacteria bacterium]|nr:hypothetical protein [Candidatus Parcubacteria bacterium]
MFYEHTIAEVKKTVTERFPEAHPVDLDRLSRPENHILWMADAIEKLNTNSQKHAAQAAWYTGRILLLCEHDLSLWRYHESQDLLSVDLKNKSHLPHRKLRLHSGK